MHVGTIDEQGRLDLGIQARALGFCPGVTVEVIRTSAGTLLIAPHDPDPTAVIDATAKPLPVPRSRQPIGRLR